MICFCSEYGHCTDLMVMFNCRSNNTLKLSALESELVTVHRCQKEIEALRDKYVSVMRSDEESRKYRQ